MDNEAVQAAKKNIKRIRRAGWSAEILGLVLILLASAAIWLFKTRSNVIIIFGASVLIGLYFVLSGAYIKNVQGRRTKALLLTNGIIAIPLCALIFPIYVCVTSINNYYRSKDLPRQVEELYKKRKGFKLKLLDLILLLLVIITGAASVTLRLNNLSKQTSNSAQANNGPVTYTSTAYKFQIKFPSSPSLSTFTLSDKGHTIPYTTFVSHSSDGSQDFDVYAYLWPTQYYDFSKLSAADMAKTLSKSADRYIQSRKGTVVSRQASTFLGKPSEDVVFTSPTLSSPVNGYVIVVYNGNFEYDIIGLGTNQTGFNNFANSFKFIN